MHVPGRSLVMESKKPPAEDSEARAPKKRKRPGRFRRWLLRPAMWGLAALALLLFLLHGALQSDWAGAYFAGLLEESLEDLLERQVWVGSVHLRLFPLGVEVEDFSLGGPSPNDPPFLTLRRALIDAEIVDLQRRVLTIHEVVLEEPKIFLDFIGPGKNNLPKAAGRSSSSDRIRTPIRINIRHVALAGGELHLLQHRLPIELTADALNAELSGGKGSELSGRVVAGTLTLQMARANPVSAAVALRLSLGPEGMRILNGRLGAPNLSLTLTGDAMWAEKEWIFEAQGQGDAAFFQQMGFLDDQIQGSFDVDGGFAWAKHSWGFRAEVTAPALEVLGREMRDVRTAVSGDRNGVRFDLEQALHAQGSLRGSLNLDTKKGQRGFEADLTLENLDLQQLADDQGIPVEGLSGRVSGVFDYRFAFGSAREGQGWADLHIVPVVEDPESIPIEGAIPLLIEQGVIRTRAARLSGPFQQIEVDGYYDIDERLGEFGYRIESQRAERLALLMPIDFDSPPLWLPTQGKGVFEGTLRVEPGRTSTLMYLDLEDVVAPGATADRVQGSIDLGVSGLADMRLELLQEAGGLIVTGSLPFERADPSDRDEIPFLISIDAAGWPMAQVQPWLPMEVPVDGPVFGSVALWGDLEALQGQLRAAVRPATFGELEIEEIGLRMDFDPTSTHVERLDLTVPAGKVTLAGSLDPVSETLELQIRSDGLHMDKTPFAEMMPGGLSGKLSIEGSLDGQLSDPSLRADLRWRELELAGEVLGREGRADIAVQMADQQLRVEGDFLGLVDLTGGGRFDNEGFDLSFDLSSQVLEELILLAGSDTVPAARGSLAGKLMVAGEFDGERPWRAAAELSSFEIEYEGFQLHILEPIVATLEDERLRIESFYIGEPETDSELFINGSIGLEEIRTLDLRLMSSLDTHWLELILPDFGLRSGRFEMLATVHGDSEEPAINGQGRLYDGRAVVPELPFSLEQVEGTLLFDPDQIFIDTLTARAAGGTLRASGSIRLFDPSATLDYRIQLSAENLNVPFPQDWMTRGSADLVVSSTDTGHQVRGSVDVERALYVQDINLGMTQMLQNVFRRQRLEVDRADDLSSNTELNIAVRGPGALRVRNNLADLHGDLDLIVRGTMARPVIFGTVRVERDGKLVLGPNEYIVERGTLRFANPFRIEPIVDVVARADVREYDITLNLSGSLEQLNVSYSSNPPLADLEILSLLATGQEQWRSGTSQRSESEASQTATDLITGQAASLVSQRTGELFGLDRLRVQPLTSSTGDLSAARVTVGKQISRDLSLLYSYDPTTTQEQVFEIEWQVQRGITLRLRQNGDETYGIDVVWKKNLQ